MATWIKNISHTVTDAFRQCWTRFPVTVCFISLLTPYLIYLVKVEDGPLSDLEATLVYYFSVGALLSLSVHLWTEELTVKTKRVLIQLVAHVCLIIDSLYLYLYAFSGTKTEIWIAHLAAITAIGLSVFCLSFLREKNDVSTWNFSMQTFGVLASSLLIGWAMCAGVCILLAAVDALLGVHISYKYYVIACILFGEFLVLMLFVGRLPKGEEKHNSQPQVSGFLNGVLHYLFIPLAVGYLVVLYAYAVRILINWDLPKGGVSWFVTVLMALCLFLEFGLYPVRMSIKTRWNELITRWLPMLILPLLLLMTVGIVRRFNDYGVSVNRLYLITLNGWFYLVCIGLFILKARRINWIPISFAILFLLTSVLPVNFASYTKKTIREDVLQTVETTCKEKLPMNDEAYQDWLESLPKEDAKMVNSKIRYLMNWFGEENVNDILSNGYATYDHFYLYYEDDTVEVETVVTDTISRDSLFFGNMVYTTYPIVKMDIPQGYSQLYALRNQSRDMEGLALTKDSTLEVPIGISRGNISDTLCFDKKTMGMMRMQHVGDVVEIPCKQEGHKFILSRLEIDSTKDSRTLLYEGYFFKKTKDYAKN